MQGVEIMKNKRQLRIFLRSNIEKESLEYFGMADDEFLDYVSDAWLNDKSNSQGRYQDIKNYIGKAIPKEAKILDMACGCGTFLFWGLLNGLDVYGIDPEEWKLEFNKYKCEVYGYPEDWNNRLIKGFGELLPFPDRYFDYVSSYDRKWRLERNKLL
jgi:2-polyprenyl-3-methyl-5-hydroxy-6-metoxy-1,4-benzoquinol methylase